jgi:hypothetical protein
LAATPPTGPAQVDAYVAGLDGDAKAIVALLRQLALAAGRDVGEHIKWNAPSFWVQGDDRITLGLERNGAVRVVLHRGAKVKQVAGFSFADASGLVRWAAPDRGVLVFRTQQELDARRDAVSDLFARWLDATAEA